MGEIKLQPWKDGARNILFLLQKRVGIRRKPEAAAASIQSGGA
jgi:hypothetical protein